jgi:hypothetical protein
VSATPGTAIRARPKDLPAEAQALASRGFHVAPVWPVRGGACACPARTACPQAGRHIRHADGVASATCASDRIRSNWATWPDAWIGIIEGGAW